MGKMHTRCASECTVFSEVLLEHGCRFALSLLSFKFSCICKASKIGFDGNAGHVHCHPCLCMQRTHASSPVCLCVPVLSRRYFKPAKKEKAEGGAQKERIEGGAQQKDRQQEVQKEEDKVPELVDT